MAEADPAYRLAALQALATGGTQAKAALDQTRAQLASSQQAATSQAMSAAAQYGLGTAGEQALTEPINRAYNAASTTMDKVAAPRLARFDTLRAPTERMFDTKAAATNVRRGGGGGRGGGGSGSSTESVDWKDTLKQYGGLDNLTYQVKQKYGKELGYKDARPAYDYLKSLGADDYTAQRLTNYGDTQKVLSQFDTNAKQGTSPARLRQEMLAAGQNAAFVNYWVPKYRELQQQVNPAAAKKQAAAYAKKQKGK